MMSLLVFLFWRGFPVEDLVDPVACLFPAGHLVCQPRAVSMGRLVLLMVVVFMWMGWLRFRFFFPDYLSALRSLDG